MQRPPTYRIGPLLGRTSVCRVRPTHRTEEPYLGAGAWDAPYKHVSIQTFIDIKLRSHPLKELPDVRQARGKRHPAVSVLAIAICAMHRSYSRFTTIASFS
jgi:hypothetical protein